MGNGTDPEPKPRRKPHGKNMDMEIEFKLQFQVEPRVRTDDFEADCAQFVQRLEASVGQVEFDTIEISADRTTFWVVYRKV